jgi:hypothetical protein
MNPDGLDSDPGNQRARVFVAIIIADSRSPEVAVYLRGVPEALRLAIDCIAIGARGCAACCQKVSELGRSIKNTQTFTPYAKTRGGFEIWAWKSQRSGAATTFARERLDPERERIACCACRSRRYR